MSNAASVKVLSPHPTFAYKTLLLRSTLTDDPKNKLLLFMHSDTWRADENECLCLRRNISSRRVLGVPHEQLSPLETPPPRPPSK